MIGCGWMNKKNMLLIIIIILSNLSLCGCMDQGLTTEPAFEKIIIESDVVELSIANISFTREEMYTDAGESYFYTTAVEVKYLFHNLLDRRANISFFVEFYNSYNEKLFSIGPRSILLTADYTEKAFTNVNEARYDGDRASEVDYVKIIAFEF